MVKFKKFIEKFRKTNDGHIIVNDPVHFRMDQPPYKLTNDGHIIVNDPVHFRMDQPPKKNLSEEKGFHHYNNENKEKHGDTYELSDKLHDATAKNLSKDERHHIREYTRYNNDRKENGSKRLNMSLAKGHEIHPDDKGIHKTIMDNAKASGHEVHLFSGTGRDFEEMHHHTKDKIFHFPAHTSATHDAITARDFASNKGKKGVHHIMHIHVKPHDKILHVSNHSEVKIEHETIIPSGTKLKYHNTTSRTNSIGDEYRTHHFTVHSQE